MSAAYGISRGSRFRVLFDLLVLGWVAGCVVLGILVAREVRGLTTVSDTLVTAGRAIDETGLALGPLEGLPFIGDDVSRLIERAHDTAQAAQASGAEGGERIQRVSTLLGLAVAAIPTLPVLAVYVPVRVAWVRDRRAIRRAVAGGTTDQLDALLAHRALVLLSSRRLIEVSTDPVGDLAGRRYRLLADAELRRLGLERRPASPFVSTSAQ